MHRNGYFVVKISLFIGIFNAIMIYLPFTSNKFGDFYGLSNAKTVFCFLIPYYLITKMTAMTKSKKCLFILASSTLCYKYSV